eukprot:s286_g7.t1
MNSQACDGGFYSFTWTSNRSYVRQTSRFLLLVLVVTCLRGHLQQALAVEEALQAVKSSISAAGPRHVRLIAVSKFIPADVIRTAHDAGQVDFGENYVQELLDKAAELPNSIRWHFIGRLQSNKVKKLLELPNLVSIETVDSANLAKRIATVAADTRTEPLDLSIQVDTSNEETKGGVKPDDATDLAESIVNLGSSVRLAGLMTIGAPGDLTAFDRLKDVRTKLAEHLQVPEESLQLSMGMSGDFIEAIKRGATSVRVGSSIFGARPLSRPPRKASVTRCWSTSRLYKVPVPRWPWHAQLGERSERYLLELHLMLRWESRFPGTLSRHQNTLCSVSFLWWIRTGQSSNVIEDGTSIQYFILNRNTDLRFKSSLVQVLKIFVIPPLPCSLSPE